MQKIQRKSKKTFFFKIFSMLFLTAVLFVGLSAGSLFLLRGELLRTGLREQSSYISAYATALDNIFFNANSLIGYLESNPMISRLEAPNYRESTDYVTNEKNIFAAFSTFSNTSREIEEIFLYRGEQNQCYTSSGITEPETYFKNRFFGEYEEWKAILDQEYPKAQVKRLSFEKTIDTELTAYRFPASSLYVVKTLYSAYDRSVIGTLVIGIDESFVEGLFENDLFAQDRRIYISDEDGAIVASNTQEPLLELMEKDKNNILAEGGDSWMQKIGLLSCRISSANELRYIVFTPIEVLIGSVDRLLFITGALSFVLMAVVILFGYLGSRRVYRPIEGIVEALKNASDTASVHEKDETEFMKRHVMEMIAANYSLKNAVADASPFILEALLFKLMRGSASADEMLESTAESYGIHFGHGFYSVVVIRMELQTDSEEQFRVKYGKRFYDLLQAVLDRWLVSVVGTREDEFAAVIYCKTKEECEAMTPQLTVLNEELMREIPSSRFTISRGNDISNITSLKESYRRALDTIRLRRISDSGVIVRDGEEGVVSFTLPADFELELTNMLKKEQYDTARSYIRGQFEYNMKNDICFQEYLQLCYLINGLLLRFIRSKSVILYRDVIKIDPHTSLYSVERLNEIVCFNLSVLIKFADSQELQTESVVDRVLRYVEEHFTEDINLTIVSNQLGYTSNYLSRLFKQAKGINFTDYINRKRVEYARALLKNGNQTIKQIAQNVGFNSATLFIRTFEKYEGMTPGEYRKLK